MRKSVSLVGLPHPAAVATTGGGGGDADRGIAEMAAENVTNKTCKIIILL